MWQQTNLPAGCGIVLSNEIIMIEINRWEISRLYQNKTDHLSILFPLLFPRDFLSSICFCLFLYRQKQPLPLSLALSVSLILSASRGLTIFKFITIRVAVLLTSAAKIYPPPPPCRLSSPARVSSQVFEGLIIYLSLYFFIFFTFNDFFHSAELRECFFFYTTNYQFPIGDRRHYLLN